MERVKLATHKKTNQKVAVKYVKKKDMDAAESCLIKKRN